MGDINIKLLNVDTHTQSAQFRETMYLHSFVPLITKPTRVTNHKATLIDNIFTNQPHESYFYGILCTDISDHFPLFLFDRKHTFGPNEKFSKTRQFSHKNIEAFKRLLSQTEWTHITNCEHAQEAFSNFHKLFKDKYEKCFPVKVSKSSYSNKCKWLSSGLI